MKIDHILQTEQLDAIVLTSRQYRRYFSGFTGSDGLLVLTPAEKYLFVDGRYTIQAKQQATDAQVTEFSLGPYQHLTEFAFKRVGFEDETISYAQYRKLQDALPAVELVGVSQQLNELRMVKTPKELALMQKAADISDAAFTHILSYIKPGVTELDIAVELEFFMRRQGAEGLSFDTIVAAGERSALPHATPTNRKIQCGELVLMDYGCVYQGYCSDMTRTVAVGQVPQQQKDIYHQVLKAQQACLDCLCPGITGAQADRAARDVIEQAGYPLVHSTGHGVGLEIHEEPRLSPKSPHTLQPGMVVTVEPGIYAEGLCGVRIEDMVAITETGYRNFTRSSKEWTQL